jgi:RND family efflux transporter MFP subunit
MIRRKARKKEVQMMATKKIPLRKTVASGAAVAVWAGAIALGCGEEPPPPAPVAQPVKILTVSGGSGGASLEFPGVISPSQNAEPAFEVPGKIIEFPVDEAQVLEEGAVIARLDPRDFQAEVDKARANLNKTATDLKRFKILYEKGVNPKTDVERAEQFYEITEANLRTAEKALEDTVLRAPFSGTVAKKLVDDFQNVQAKQPIVILQDESTLEIDVNVPESDFARMTPGLTIEERNRRARIQVFVSSIPGRSFPARIKEFSTAADPVTRTFKATFAFDRPDDVTVRPGMTAKVTLTPSEGQAATGAVSIPARAVLTDDTGEAFVWVVDPETMKVKRTSVVAGDLSGENIAIQSGLAGGTQIAISGVHQLRDGMQVRRFGQ